MAKTKEIVFNCANVQVTPNGGRSVGVFIEQPEVDELLAEIDDDDLTEFCERNYQPEDIFPETQLEKWAEANGYVKQDQNDN